MTRNTIVYILNQHYIQYEIQDGRVYALEEYNIGFGEWHDVTDMNRLELYIMLGY